MHFVAKVGPNFLKILISLNAERYEKKYFGRGKIALSVTLWEFHMFAFFNKQNQFDLPNIACYIYTQTFIKNVAENIFSIIFCVILLK